MSTVVKARGERPADLYVSVEIPRAEVIEVFGTSFYRLHISGPRGLRFTVVIPQRYCKEVTP